LEKIFCALMEAVAMRITRRLRSGGIAVIDVHGFMESVGPGAISV